jgi:RNase P protein component
MSIDEHLKQPDRFTRVVAADKKFEKKVFAAYRAEGWVDETLMDVILARERRAVVRLVKAQPAALHGVFIRRDSLLAALKRRAR